MKRILISCVAVLTMALAGGCTDEDLAVENPVSGDTKRVMGTPDDAEKLIGSYYKRWYGGVYGTSMDPMTKIMSFENFSSLNNECMNSRYPFTGASNGNAPGNNCDGNQRPVYFVLSEVQRVASGFLKNIADSVLKFPDAGRERRDKAFAELLRGLSIGYIALVYDSLAVVSPGMEGADPGVLLGYDQAMDSAYAALDRAIDLARGGLQIPADWIPTPTALDGNEFIKMAKSYKALFRANIGRTPAEHDAANWDAIIADADSGFTADHYHITSTTAGPGGGYRNTFDGGTTWHQMPGFIIGMGDVSGSYEAWLKQPVGDRGAGNVGFFMVTPDLRFPQGETRTLQQDDFAVQDCELSGGDPDPITWIYRYVDTVETRNGKDTTIHKRRPEKIAGLPARGAAGCRRYFTNRPSGGDQYTGVGWGWSNYNFNRYHWWVNKGDAGSARNGKLIIYPKAVLDMTKAEGLIKKGRYQEAATLINLTRTANGLPPITAFDGTSPVPGGTVNCVPKTPYGNGPSATLACGNILEAMKWEKRMESAYNLFAQWFLDSRGWGDLPEGTALYWAEPYADMQARGKLPDAIYGAGTGAGNAPNSFAAKGTYGW